VITAWVLLGVTAVLVVGNAIFVAADTALVTVDRDLVESRAREGSVRFGRVRENPQRLSMSLSGAQLGYHGDEFGDWIGGGAVDRQLLRAPLDALRLEADVTDVAAFALALLLATAVQMVHGELVPKNIALSRPAGSVVWVVLPLLVFTKLTRPLIAVLNGPANQLTAPGRGGSHPRRVGIGERARRRASPPMAAALHLGWQPV
jgi:CBS domain containing-hemolysin-like protein